MLNFLCSTKVKKCFLKKKEMFVKVRTLSLYLKIGALDSFMSFCLNFQQNVLPAFAFPA